tara:strand:- start:2679 stop:4547 length:1869 start_codon:yes stop_codon:yes gene_type:complete
MPSSKKLVLGLLLLTASFSVYANNCIIGDGVTDCSAGNVDISVVSTGILNNGTILGDEAGAWAGISHDSSTVAVNGITNNGTITGWVEGVALWSPTDFSGGITNNVGALISGFRAISTEYAPTSRISFINNAGSIKGFNLNVSAPSTDAFYGIYNKGIIDSITNTGTIYATRNLAVSYGIYNTGTITTFNNDQGSSGSNPVTYKGILPTNYNSIVNSISDFGQIVFSSVSGTTNFGVHSTSIVDTSATYSSVVDGLTSAELNDTTTGTVALSGTSYTWTLTDADSDLAWDLNFNYLSGSGSSSGSGSGPSAADTQTSIQSASYGISSQFAGFAITTNYANLNTYDCGLFDAKGGCFSVGGRYSDVNGSNSSDSSSSALVAVGGFKINDNLRVAGFIDQQANSSTPKGINLDNKGPMVGMSLVWNQHPDHLGYQVKVANAYQSKDLTITRTTTGDAEAGRGDTSVEVQSYVAEVSYQFSDGVKTSYRPYFALRRAIIKQDGYTETGVDNPLTFNTLEDKSTTIIMGMKAKYKLNAQVTFNGALGFEHDVNRDIDKLQATSSTITGLTAVGINSSINKTRPVATLGATYHISPNQTLSAQTQYQELAYTSTSAKTAYFNYSIGF